MFYDQKLQEHFDKNGYVLIDLLNNEQVEALKKQYFELESVRGGMRKEYDVKFDKEKEITYEFTFIDSSKDYKQVVFDKITEVFLPLINRILVDYQPIIANYIHKSSLKGEVPMHQNWAFVDERKYSSISVWCPLVDSNEKNGTLQVVPGSHKRFAPVRGPLIPWELEHLKEDIIKNDMIPFNIKAGQAAIIDDSIIHYSAPNQTEGLRLAIQLIMIPPKTSSIHYHMTKVDDKEVVNVYEVDREFYMAFHPWLKPKEQKLIKTLPYKKVNIDYPTFKKMMNKKAIHDRNSILDKVVEIFN